jgi:hypothetical protein
MDPFSGKVRHVFFGILWTYRSTFFSMAIMLAIMALSAFLSPIGINRLLRYWTWSSFHVNINISTFFSYLENPNEESFMKPWFWILLLFLGPMITSVSFQWYIFISVSKQPFGWSCSTESRR